VPEEGVEPTLPIRERDFESRASASSATPASGGIYRISYSEGCRLRQRLRRAKKAALSTKFSITPERDGWIN
jgi:hypothetical protein